MKKFLLIILLIPALGYSQNMYQMAKDWHGKKKLAPGIGIGEYTNVNLHIYLGATCGASGFTKYNYWNIAAGMEGLLYEQNPSIEDGTFRKGGMRFTLGRHYNLIGKGGFQFFVGGGVEGGTRNYSNATGDQSTFGVGPYGSGTFDFQLFMAKLNGSSAIIMSLEADLGYHYDLINSAGLIRGTAGIRMHFFY